MTTYHEHIPVLLHASVDDMITNPNGVYIDGTLGGGGHSSYILSQLGSDGKLFGIDQDDEALEAATSRIGEDGRFEAIKGNFGYLSTILPPQYKGKVDGILLDLGVSTHQIKEGARGFSFQEDGPLDMRMGNLSGTSAYQIVNHYSYEDLRDVIFHYGEERKSRQIAKAIIDARPIETTRELRDVISELVPEKFQIKSIARVFQGIRIEVNRELEVLEQVLEQALDVLAVGGRISVISYHSLEDRMVKRFFRSGNRKGIIEKDFYGNPLSPLKPVNNQVITPSLEEISVNPAARSAKLRIAEKIDGGSA